MPTVHLTYDLTPDQAAAIAGIIQATTNPCYLRETFDVESAEAIVEVLELDPDAGPIITGVYRSGRMVTKGTTP